MILVTGKNGQVGHAVGSLLAKRDRPFTAVDRHDLDLSKPERIQTTLDRLQPSVIINPAAYTNVELAEKNTDLAFTVNAKAPEQIAKWCAENGAALVHFSTDYVFDGRNNTPWKETDATNPINVYGASKLAGEQAILGHLPNAIILRTSWVYASQGSNFVLKIRDLARTRETLTVVNDQFGTPNSATFLAETTLHLLSHLDQLGGVYNLSAMGVTTWFDFAAYFLEEFKGHGETFAACDLRPVSSAQFPTIAARPPYSCLDTSKLATALSGHLFPGWKSCFQREFF